MTTGASTLAPAPSRRYVKQVMGLPVTLAVRGARADDVLAQRWGRVVTSLRDADEVFSTYRPDSWVSRLGPSRGAPLRVPTRGG